MIRGSTRIQVHEQRGLWERELEQRLRQAAAAHQDHLEQVIRTQKQLHDIEQAHALEVQKHRFTFVDVQNCSGSSWEGTGAAQPAG